MSADVSVVVCVYTMARWPDIDAGVRALARQTLPPREVLIVVDHNDDLLARARAELPALHPQLRVVANAAAKGLSGARNTGIAEAGGDLVAFLDDDAEPETDWLATLVEPFGTADVVATGGRAVPRWPDRRPAWFPEEFDWVVGSCYRGMPEVRSDVRNVIGASMAMRATAFAAAGVFAEDVGRTALLPMGCEETELCIRMRRGIPGARVVYVPESVVHHRVSADRVRPRYFVRRCLAEGASKDKIAAMIGNDAATETERSYATRTLPLGVLRGVGRAARGDVAGLQRAAMIVVGLVVTTFGFLRSKLARSRQR